MIRLCNIDFSYPAGRPVFNGLNFDFSNGDRLGLVGPNGSGKTTLFHIIMGLLHPKSGDVEIFGKRCTREPDFREVRERIGLLFQDPNDQLFCATVEEDVAFGPFNLGKPREEVLEIVSETLESVGLAGFEKRITYRLSGGEKRLVSLATVLAMKPQVLLLDEPAAGLDTETTERITKILNGLNLSSIIISHDIAFLKNVTTSLFIVQNGKIDKLG